MLGAFFVEAVVEYICVYAVAAEKIETEAETIVESVGCHRRFFLRPGLLVHLERCGKMLSSTHFHNGDIACENDPFEFGIRPLSADNICPQPFLFEDFFIGAKFLGAFGKCSAVGDYGKCCR